MRQLSRREFLEQSMMAAAAVPSAAAFAQAAPARAVGPNEVLRVAVVGTKGRGGSHLGAFGGMKDVQVAAIVDIDENVVADTLKGLEKKGLKKPDVYEDFRKMLEDKSIDAISVATCNHTHTLISLYAVQAGKHVYVEKPLSHNVWEGRKLVEAARKYGRIVQHGTQSRSGGGHRKAAQFLAEGKLGKIKVSRGLCYKRRGSIGTLADSPVPKGVNYDLWLGPAPERPFNKNRFHYNWHWHWDYGNGDIGNQGVHEMDKARWYLGKKELPLSVTSIGGRFGYTDQAETANTQIVCMDYGDGQQVIFEVRGLETPKHMTEGIGNLVHCEKGYVAGSTAFDLDGKKVEMDVHDDGRGGDHFRNFVNAVKSGKHEDLNADVLDGHLSAALGHLGNISLRLGEPQPLSKNDPFGKNDEGNESFNRMREHLKSNSVDLDKTMVRVGRTLRLHPKAETFVDDAEACKMLTREYRKPFVVPEYV